VELDDYRKSLLALLRTEGVSVEYLEETKKEELQRFLLFLHVEKGMSLNDVADPIGNKTSGYTSWLYRQLGIKCRSFEEARLKGSERSVGSTNGDRSRGTPSFAKPKRHTCRPTWLRL
jgi:hypothetical protein